MAFRKQCLIIPTVCLAALVAVPPAHSDETQQNKTSTDSTPAVTAPAEPTLAANEKPAPRALRGLRPGETSEQQRERLVKELEGQTGELSPEQKARIKEIYKTAADQLADAREDDALSDDEKLDVPRRVRTEMLAKIDELLTEAQRARQKQKLAELEEKAMNPQLNGGLQQGESLAQRRRRLLRDYETALPDLSPRQKTDLLEILETADDVIAATRRDEERTEAKKQAVIARVKAGVSHKTEKILTKSQLAKWQRAQQQKEKETPKKPAAAGGAAKNN